MFQLDSSAEDAPRAEARSIATPARATDPARPGLPVDPRRIISVLRRSRWLFLAAGVIGTGAGYAAASKLAPVRYESQATLVWEPTEAEQADRQRAMKTLVDTVKIPTVLAAVRERLDLPVTLDRLGRDIEVTSTPQSNVLIVTASSDDPDRAKRLAQATVDSLLEQRTSVSRDRAKEALARTDDDLARAIDRAERARGRLTAFRRDNQLIDVSAQTQAGIQQAVKLQQEADSAKVEADAQKARALRLQNAAKGQSERAVMSERVIMPRATKLADTRIERTQLEAELAADHPKVSALRAAEEALTRSTGHDETTAERTTGRNPLWDTLQQGLVTSEADERAQRTRETGFRELAVRTTAELEKLSQVSGQAAILEAQAELTQNRVHELESTRATHADALATPNAGLRILVEPALPTSPAQSLKKPILAGVPIAALFLALVVTIARALWGLRAHTPSEVAFWTRLPVIASSTWPNERSRLQDLVADLALLSGSSRGRMLLVALSTQDVEACERLGRRLNKALARGPQDHGKRGEHPGSNNDNIIVSRHALLSNEPSARRALRAAERAIVVVRSRAPNVFDLSRIRALAAPSTRLVIVVIGAPADLSLAADQIGDASRFWTTENQPTSSST